MRVRHREGGKEGRDDSDDDDVGPGRKGKRVDDEQNRMEGWKKESTATVQAMM